MTKQFNLFIPITKVDEEKRLVYGLATAEKVDKSGEIFDYESSLPYYKEWSGEIHKASGGKSFGNVREMHTSIAAGKLVQINFNDDEKQIEVCAKIVNDSTWEKVTEGVLTGFSHGGEYIKTWKDDENPKLMRYTARPAELSVVDNPCLGAATFELLRADGSTEMRKFKNKETPMSVVTVVDGKAVKPKTAPVQKWEASDGKTFEKKSDCEAHELGLETQGTSSAAFKALDDLAQAVTKRELDSSEDFNPLTLGKKDFSDDKRKKLATEGKALPDGSFPIENTHDLKNAIHAYGRAADKEKAKAHIIARAKDLGAEAELPEDWRGSKKDDATAKAVMPKLKKGLYEVCRAADLLMSMESLCSSLVWEAVNEGDGSPLPNEFRDMVTRMCAFLEALVTEECSELAEPHAVELMGAEMMAMSAVPEGLVKLVNQLTVANETKFSKFHGALTDAVSKIPLQKAKNGGDGNWEKAKGHLTKAMDSHEDTMGHHAELGKAHEDMRDCMGKMEGCMKTLDVASLLKSLAPTNGEPINTEPFMKAAKEATGGMATHLKNMDDHMDKAEKYHGKMAKTLAAVSAAHSKASDAMGDGKDEDADKSTTVSDLAKASEREVALQQEVATLRGENDLLKVETEATKKTLGDLTKKVTEEIPALMERLRKVEETPLPGKGVLFDTGHAGTATPLTKGHEGQQDPAKDVPVEAITALTHGASPDEQRRIMGIRL